MSSKYKNAVLKIVSRETIKSTNEILKDLEKSTGKSINWHMVYRILDDLRKDGKVKRLETKIGFFWTKR